MDVEKTKRWAIWQFDWLDDLLGHPFRGAFCNTIIQSAWWGTPDFKCKVCGFESHVGPTLRSYTIEPCPGCQSKMRSEEWREQLHNSLTVPTRPFRTAQP